MDGMSHPSLSLRSEEAAQCWNSICDVTMVTRGEHDITLPLRDVIEAPLLAGGVCTSFCLALRMEPNTSCWPPTCT